MLSHGFRVRNRSAVMVARRGVDRMLGNDYHASKENLFMTRISHILPKCSPIKVRKTTYDIFCSLRYPFQSVFYHATSWLQDCGVLQKMDNDIWMVIYSELPLN